MLNDGETVADLWDLADESNYGGIALDPALIASLEKYLKTRSQL